MKRFAITSIALALALAVVPLSAPGPTAWAHLSEVPVAWQTDGDVAVSQPIEAPATNIGLTWEGEAPDAAWFRVEKEGRWGGWTRLPLESDHGPDPGTSEGRNAKPGSDLVWVGPVDGVQYRIEGGDEDASAAVIDTTSRTQPRAQQFGNLFSDPTADAATAMPGQPTIRPRSAWDPAGSCAPKAEPGLAQITHAFVHHTTGTNSYSAADVPSRILAICLYHTNSQGWDDIGYNFLIDRFGVIWEGRAGGIDKGVQGAHTAGFNSYSIGVAFIGDHAASGPTAAAQAALVNLLAWKFGVHNVDPSQPNTVVSKGSGKYVEGTPVSLRPVSGHRDGQATSCPGEACYARIPTLRSQVDAKWDQIPLGTYRSPSIGDFDGDGAEEAAVFRTSNGGWLVTETNGATGTWATFSTRTGWGSQMVGDFNGDGRDDLANFHPSNGTWWVASSTGSGFTTRLWADFSTASGWSRQIVGDFNGDGRDDIANFHPSNGTWWVSQSTGSGFTTRLWADFSTPSGWTVQVAGDFDGDARDDIANRHSGNGTWWVSRSTGRAFTTSLWGATPSFDHISHAWAQDVDENGRDDMMVIDAYNGFIDRQLSSGTAFTVATLADTPWRTTLGGGNNGPSSGPTSWVFFGQEFAWIHLTGLDTAAAGAQIAHSLPRS